MALPLEVSPVKEPPMCGRCSQPGHPVYMQELKGFSGLYQCPLRADHQFSEEKGKNAGPPPMSGGEARRPFGGTWALKLVPKELVLSEAERRQAFQEELNGTTLDALYQHPLPPVVQAPNKGGKGGKPGRGSRSKGRKRKKDQTKKKRERPLADYQ